GRQTDKEELTITRTLNQESCIPRDDNCDRARPSARGGSQGPMTDPIPVPANTLAARLQTARPRHEDDRYNSRRPPQSYPSAATAGIDPAAARSNLIGLQTSLRSIQAEDVKVPDPANHRVQPKGLDVGGLQLFKGGVEKAESPLRPNAWPRRWPSFGINRVGAVRRHWGGSIESASFAVRMAAPNAGQTACDFGGEAR